MILQRLAAEDARSARSLTILMTCWPGSSAWRQLGADGLLADARDEAADDPDVDVGLEQGDADLAQHLVDVVLGQAALAAEPLEDAVEAVGQCVEHAARQATWYSTVAPSRVPTRAAGDTPTYARLR